MEHEIELDVRKLSCPFPIIKTERMLEKMYPGQTLRILSSDPSLLNDMKTYCINSENEFLGSFPIGQFFLYKIMKRKQ